MNIIVCIKQVPESFFFGLLAPLEQARQRKNSEIRKLACSCSLGEKLKMLDFGGV